MENGWEKQKETRLSWSSWQETVGAGTGRGDNEDGQMSMKLRDIGFQFGCEGEQEVKGNTIVKESQETQAR